MMFHCDGFPRWPRTNPQLLRRFGSAVFLDVMDTPDRDFRLVMPGAAKIALTVAVRARRARYGNTI